MLMLHNGQMVAVLGGTVRVEMTGGQHAIVKWEELEPVPSLQDRGETEGDQYVKLVLEKNGGFGVESNGVWPEDVPMFVTAALKQIVKHGDWKP